MRIVSLLTWTAVIGIGLSCLATSHRALSAEQAEADMGCHAGGRRTQLTDVFLIAGQSNATGEPELIGGSPVVPHDQVLKYEHGEIIDGNDPVGDHSRGSAWPSFGVRYYRSTAHSVMFVPASIPGSPLSPVANVWGVGFWASGGGLSEASMAKADAALACAGRRATFKGVLWDQGENDAAFIASGKETAADYEDLLLNLIARYRTHFGPSMPFFIFQTGNGGSNEAGFAQVRKVEHDVASKTPFTLMVFSGASSFPSRGLMNKDGVHYTQQGYNEMGDMGAMRVAAYFLNRPPR